MREKEKVMKNFFNKKLFWKVCRCINDSVKMDEISKDVNVTYK